MNCVFGLAEGAAEVAGEDDVGEFVSCELLFPGFGEGLGMKGAVVVNEFPDLVAIFIAVADTAFWFGIGEFFFRLLHGVLHYAMFDMENSSKG